jgi:hypothetical protein
MRKAANAGPRAGFGLEMPTGPRRRRPAGSRYSPGKLAKKYGEQHGKFKAVRNSCTPFKVLPHCFNCHKSAAFSEACEVSFINHIVRPAVAVFAVQNKK